MMNRSKQALLPTLLIVFLLILLLIPPNPASAAPRMQVAHFNVYLPITLSDNPSQARPSEDWLSRLNDYRSAAGLNAVTEEAAYSADLANHVNYILLNITSEPIFHGETQGRPGFTPEGHRAAAESNLFAGFGGAHTQTYVIDAWMNSLYHRYGLLNPDLHMTGFAMSCDKQYCGAGLNVLRGLRPGKELRPDGIVFPGPDQQGVNPATTISWQFGGQPTAVLVNAALRDPSGGSIAITTTTPAQGEYFNMVTAKPHSLLAPNATYEIEMSVMLGDRKIQRVWRFTTNPTNP